MYINTSYLGFPKKTSKPLSKNNKKKNLPHLDHTPQVSLVASHTRVDRPQGPRYSSQRQGIGCQANIHQHPCSAGILSGGEMTWWALDGGFSPGRWGFCEKRAEDSLTDSEKKSCLGNVMDFFSMDINLSYYDISISKQTKKNKHNPKNSLCRVIVPFCHHRPTPNPTSHVPFCCPWS